MDEPGQRGARRIRHHLEPDATRGTAPDFNGPDHQGPVAQLAPPAESFLIADVRLVRLPPCHAAARAQDGAWRGVVSEEGPGRFVPGNAELTLKLKRGHPRRVCRDQVRRPEPLRSDVRLRCSTVPAVTEV